MHEASSSEEAPSLFESRLLRREAGDEWHEGGLNEPVNGAIHRREELLDKLVAQQHNVHDEAKTKMWDDYLAKAEEVIRLKAQYGIGEPPPMDIPSPE